MKLWVGLGNPGARYAGNRHNIGFMAVERIAAAHGFGPWRARFQGLAADGMLGGDKVLLLRPGTFMNLSGQSVRAAADFLKLDPADITVFHDEIDLAPGRLRLKPGGGHAGHNGLRSISVHLGDGCARVRLGVGHPGHKDAVPDYVLHDFSKADQDWLEPLLQGIADGAAALAQGDGARFQNAVALRLAPPKPKRNTAPPNAPPQGPPGNPLRNPPGTPSGTPPGNAPGNPPGSPPGSPSGNLPENPSGNPPGNLPQNMADNLPENLAEPQPAPSLAATPDTRSALQKLMDRFG